jgi:hypothetical protein
MSVFTLETGNYELPEQYRKISIDLAGLMHSVKDSSPKLYIRELLLSMDEIESVVCEFEDWERIEFTKKLEFIINLLKK